jgi:hypothetical protein
MHHKIEPIDDRADLRQQGSRARWRADVRLDRAWPRAAIWAVAESAEASSRR